ncbi:hypothetical protein Vadar_014345 [Vaccinium darrowii]|uniref:Uncharacterized protein n=1 Tax=Vaccinium darrowii TaxID=229202 RepID=A0ACB7Y0H2_9ERIC|nr:hypothetical protein Vadar_014345 [Vaccinium darrowii]
MSLENLTSQKNHNKPDSKFSNKGKERRSSRIKKKVSFNSIVKMYEPLPTHDFTSYFSESEEEKEETGKSNTDSATSRNGSDHSNYRYYNCRDSFEDEEDEIRLEESDPDTDDEESIANSDDVKMTEKEFSVQFYSLSTTSEKGVNLTNKKAENFVPLFSFNRSRTEETWIESQCTKMHA